MSYHFLIADAMHSSLFPALQEIGISYDNMPSIDRIGIKNSLNKYDGLIIRSKTFVDADLLQNSERLKVVCRAGAGIDNLDVQAIESRGIYIINAPEGNMDAVGEHSIGMLLSLFTKLNQADRQVRQGIWDREGNRGLELKDKIVGIIGYGHMGSSFARKLSGFECQILSYDRYKSGYGDNSVQETTLEELQLKADVVSFHIPLTSETKFWVDDVFIGKFKKPVYLVNTSRGEIISFKTIVNGLTSGKIAGAALDVLENENPGSFTTDQQEYVDQLVSSEKVIFTPHVAGWSQESYKRINVILITKLKRWLSGL